ncbi:unnamed protein product [Lathyrus oleraceus]|uniref:Uncharacterized protein n=1 Tax=Pisum sativum TaxID=3888 RepID=A0A9D4W914_PEA|nr:uncharacterized protein LOC127094595 [Pisum sativum]KAI5396301.1 hypothetical protein KIW84_062493 [Pisum sativum]
MSNKVVLIPVGSSNRRQPLLQQNKSSLKAGTRLGEAVGGTAAVCCCCPCALANIVYLAIYKVPASLCHKALKKSRQRRRRRLQSSSGEGMLPPKPMQRCTCGCCDDFGVRVHPTCSDDDDDVDVKSESLGVEEEDKEAVELEKEMWETFYGTGFWRSSSQRNKDSSSFSPSQSQRVFFTASAPNLQVPT